MALLGGPCAFDAMSRAYGGQPGSQAATHDGRSDGSTPAKSLAIGFERCISASRTSNCGR